MMRAAAGPAGKPDARFLPTRVTFPPVKGTERGGLSGRRGAGAANWSPQ